MDKAGIRCGDRTYQLGGFMLILSVDHEGYKNDDGCYGYGHNSSQYKSHDTITGLGVP